MTAKYLLPCQCGQQLPVDVSQAGLTISCTCGTKVAVPTLRGLRALPQVAADDDNRPKAAAWGPREGMALIGVLIALIGLGMAGWFFFTPPPRPTKEMIYMNELSDKPEIVYKQFLGMRHTGIDTTPEPMVEEYENKHRIHVAGTYACFGVAAVGVLVIGMAFLLFQKPRRRPVV